MEVLSRKKKIGPDAVLQRKPDVLFNVIDGDVVMLSIDNSEYYGMDKVGSRIWELLKNPIRFKDLIESLLKEYNVQKEKCVEDTMKYLFKLTDKKLITIA